MGNLLNFPKHIFGFPFAGYSTEGHEALSLCLYSYRQESSKTATVLHVVSGETSEQLANLHDCASRIGMRFQSVSFKDLDSINATPAVVLVGLTSPDLDGVAAWAKPRGASVHIHVWDRELRNVFIDNAEPVHFQLPKAVRSMSLHTGLFNYGYQLYRDTKLRDLHFDLPYSWQTAYMSPNEGGSGNSTPFFIDFCYILLGWRALRDVAMAACSTESERWQTTVLGRLSADISG